ncbi:MAG: TIGR03862 family flavoprotein, partial [Dokdonella sp.]
MTNTSDAIVHIIGGGPAGLMAAEAARASGIGVELHERMGSVGRKLLVAGKGGLNLTHSDANDRFVEHFGSRRAAVAEWLEGFDAQALREWARGLGIETFVGSSGRVFPMDLKAAPLLRRWVHRLRESGVKFHVRRRWTGWTADGALRFETDDGEIRVDAGATILALGGGSWPVLGSDGAWVETLVSRAIGVAPLQAANCGFDVDWSAHLRDRFGGAPVKPVTITHAAADGDTVCKQGEFVITRNGVEGSLIYAMSARLRDDIGERGPATIHLDLVPGRDMTRLARDLARPRGSRSRSEHLRRNAGIDGVKAAL